ncbi:MAG: CoA-binding protein [candidate division Zixibacteria bacterium]|nr:CoA-binding protein [candidate division Zixibacteria bacterium]
MSFSNPSMQRIKEILEESKTIAVVGLSNKEDRDSNRVARFLQERGYRVIPVNPGQREILGEVSYSDLAAIPEKIDIVDVFRKSEAIPEIAKAAIAVGAGILWLQEGVRHDEATDEAHKAGLTVLQDICIRRVAQEL